MNTRKNDNCSDRQLLIKAVLMAGGRGTRISSIAHDIPKPLIPIDGKPVLLREIECLKSQGFVDIIITVSYMAELIMDYFGDGSKYGVRIDYFVEKEPLGNAGALFKIKDKLTDTFLLLNADSIFDVDFNRFIDYHLAKKGIATIFTHPNSHPQDSGLVVVDENKRVVDWLAKEDCRPEWFENRVNAGLHVLEKRILNVTLDKPRIDLDRDLLRPLKGTGKLFAYDSTEYVKDMGTPDRYYQVCRDFDKSLPQKKNLINKQKAIFLDRDGTINKYVGFLRNIDEFELLPGVSEAICRINHSDYLAIVVTNQPVIARGEVTVKQLNEIHKKMETLLGRDGAFIDALYYCPHHPHGGYSGEVKELKIDCECRKPKPGMLIKAAIDYNIDLSKSWMIGDDRNDILAGTSAGCKSILIKNLENYGQDEFFIDLLSAVNFILGE